MQLMCPISIDKCFLCFFDFAQVEKDQPLEELLYQWYEEGCMWDRVQLEDMSVIRNALTWSKLMTLGRACQSPMAARMLHDSQLLTQLNSSIMGKSHTVHFYFCLL